MLKTETLLLLIICSVLCVSTTPVMADLAPLFDFHFGSIDSSFTYATGAFSAGVNPSLTSGSVSRLQDPMGTAVFVSNNWGLGGDFSVSMTITNIAASSADASGTFNITDIYGDTISGDLEGNWGRVGPSNFFAGMLSNVIFTDNALSGGDGLDGNFDAHFGAPVSMSFTYPAPWLGSLLELSSSGAWFGDGEDYDTISGSADATVVPIPVPTAVLLGTLGLGVGAAGLKLRKYV